LAKEAAVSGANKRPCAKVVEHIGLNRRLTVRDPDGAVKPPVLK
jgi:hypothetical protein